MKDYSLYYKLNPDGSTSTTKDIMEALGGDFETTRRIAQTEIGDVRISTVFLGIDHAFMHEQPILFETMIFGGTHDQKQERYSTKKEAEEGHARWVEEVKKGFS